MKSSTLITIGLIIFVLLGSAVVLFIKNNPKLNYGTALCIASKTTIYTQLGCIHCETQEKMLEGYLSEFNIVDCFYNVTKCTDAKVTVTPTWFIYKTTKKIEYTKHEGVMNIKELKEATGC